MTHGQLVQELNTALGPMRLQFSRIHPEPRPSRSVLVLSRLPGFDEEKSDLELATLIRKRLIAEPEIAEATRNLDITLE